jgi:phage shock protein A
MDSIDAFQTRLRDETATVEKEIQSHNQQVEALSKRLEGLKRAAELFDSEHDAIAELLQAGTAEERLSPMSSRTDGISSNDRAAALEGFKVAAVPSTAKIKASRSKGH